MPELTIDGRKISVEPGTTVIQAAEKLGIYVPRYCYHPGLSIAGNCRICLVEVEKMPKLQIACNTLAQDNMVVHTQSEGAKAGRRSVLEFLLANHPLDCPVCDQSGECDLQNFYMEFGLYDPRFQEHKVKKTKKAVRIGPHVYLDQERCILCSRCVRFTDEITKTSEFGIFNRGEHAELDVVPGTQLDNAYSANVVDICPVGALTEADFRFKARVWYLSAAPSVCDGCSRGCNVDLHFVLDRPHLNDGARLVRVKPRYNPAVNQWWMCDEGRYGLSWIDRDRLEAVRGPASKGSGWSFDEALEAIAASLTREGRNLGVLASAKLSNEELHLIREVFQGARISAALPERPGSSDDFLIQADKNPNTAGARCLGLLGPGADDGEEIVEAARGGELDALWVFGHDLVGLFDASTVQELARSLRLFVYSGSNANPTAEYAHWVLPTAAYVEKDGTFVNCGGRVQRIGRAFPPRAGSREDWRALLQLAALLGRPLDFEGPEQIFDHLAGSEAVFAGLSYEEIGLQGAPLAADPKPQEAVPS